jgi:hypothetical protein
MELSIKSTPRKKFNRIVLATALISGVGGMLRAEQPVSLNTNNAAKITANAAPWINTQLGENLKDDTPVMEAQIHAVPKGTNMTEVDYLLNGLTEKGYWCQFGLGHGTNGFDTVFQIWDVESHKPLTPPYRKHFGCSTNDSIDLTLALTNGLMRITAKDLDNKLIFESLGLPLRNGSTNFVGGNEDKWGQTSIFTETYSSNVTAEILPQTWTVLKPETMTTIDWIIRKAEVTMQDSSSGKMPPILVGIRSGWVNANQQPLSLFEIGPKDANIVWHDGHRFITGGTNFQTNR